MKAMASSRTRHLRVKLPNTERYVGDRYAPVYGQSKALCEAVGRTKFIYPPKYANRVNSAGRSYFEHDLTCIECLKELADRRLMPDKNVSDFERRCQVDREKILKNVLAHIARIELFNNKKGGNLK